MKEKTIIFSLQIHIVMTTGFSPTYTSKSSSWFSCQQRHNSIKAIKSNKRLFHTSNINHRHEMKLKNWKKMYKRTPEKSTNWKEKTSWNFTCNLTFMSKTMRSLSACKTMIVKFIYNSSNLDAENYWNIRLIVKRTYSPLQWTYRRWTGKARMNLLGTSLTSMSKHTKDLNL